MSADRPLVVYADGLDSPRSSPTTVAAAAGLPTDDVDVLLGWTPEYRPWLASPGLRGRTIIPGYALAGAVANGRLRYLPVRLSAVPSLLTAFEPEVAVVTAVRRGSELVFGMSVGWGPAAARAADRVVVEVDSEGWDMGGPPVPGNIVAVIDRSAPVEPAMKPRAPNAVDRQIAGHLLPFLPDAPSLQLGPGGVAEAIMDSLDRPVRIRSGLVTDVLVDLDARGLLVGEALAAYAWGGAPVAGLVASGRLRLAPLEETHDLTRLSALEGFVGCNTALQVGLDGAVNVEWAGGRLVSGVGGHADFCTASSRSVGGLSVIALSSSTRDGASTIVPRVETVSTGRSDVQLVVTEHGVADLRGIDDRERALRLAAIAAPEHREELSEAARAGHPG